MSVGRRALVLVACLLVGACVPEAKPAPAPDPVDPNGEITTAISGEPDTIDPQKESFPSEIAEIVVLGSTNEYPDPQDWLSTVIRSTSTVQGTGYTSVEFDSLVRSRRRRAGSREAARPVLARAAGPHA
jgi:ABC-type transport system substrate-binding protein